MICLQEMELEQRMIGVTARLADLVQTERATVTTMPSASKTMSVETTTASTTGTRQTRKLTAAFQVTLLLGKLNKACDMFPDQ